MNSSSKRIAANVTSLVELKAELARKQQEIRTGAQANKPSDRPAPKKKLNIFSKENPGVNERAEGDVEEKQEERDALKLSRDRLEAKAKIYDKIISSKQVPEEDGSEGYLVDFQGKAIDGIWEKRRREEPREEEETVEEKDEPPAPEDEWVDYTDSLGRSRRCLRRDLADNQSRDAASYATRAQSAVQWEAHRTQLQEKWAEKDAEAANQDAVHYANVQYDEVRAHGVGFYKFSHLEQQRHEQMAMLDTLRKQTESQRATQVKAKAKRAAMMKARLEKVKQRRLAQGIVVETPASDEEEEVQEEAVIEPLTRDDSLRKDAPEREWDRGKVVSYEERRREEREPEFAPPTILYAQPPAYRHSDSPVAHTSRPAHANKQTSGHSAPSSSGDDLVNTANGRQSIPDGPENSRISSEAGSASIEEGRSARQVRGQVNFDRMDELIAGKLKSLRAEVEMKEMEEKERQSMASQYGHAESLMSDVEYSYSDVNVESLHLPDTSQPPPNIAEMTANSAMPQVPDIIQGIDFTQPPPPPPSAPTMPVNQTPPVTAPSYHPDVTTAAASTVPAATSSIQERLLNISNSSSAGCYNTELDESESVKAPRDTVSTGKPVTISAAPVLFGRKPAPYDPNRHLQPDIVPQAARYERVHLHTVPASLPAPPAEGGQIEYPSQESVHGESSQHRQAERHWQKQYDGPPPRAKSAAAPLTPALDTDNIPFESPYVKRSEKE